jgi:hypothetical protein
METQKYNPLELIVPLETLPHGGDIILFVFPQKEGLDNNFFVAALKITNIVTVLTYHYNN